MKRGKHEYVGPVGSDFAIKFRNLVEFAWLRGWDAAANRYRNVASIRDGEDYTVHLVDRTASLDKFIRNHADDLIARLT